MPSRTVRPLACALLAALAGCADEPSFQLAWRISTDPAVTDPDLTPRLCSVTRCSEVGIEKVRLEIRGADDPEGAPLRYVKEYACFQSAFDAVFDECDQEPIEAGPLAGWIDGPTLAPGEYEVELIGLRRNGGEWPCTSTDELGNVVELPCARDQASLTIREGELPELAFSLAAPGQCDDGVDNDRDGRVDASDPACTLGESIESFDAGLTLFQLSVGILGNSLIEPVHVGIDAFALTIDDQPFETLDPMAGLELFWPWRFRLLDQRLDAGMHTLGMVALGPDGALTEPQTIEFTVDAEQGAFVIHEFAFGSGDFLAPIVEDLRVSWDLDEIVKGGPCGNPLLAIEDVRLRLLDPQATPLPVNLAGSDPLAPEGDWSVFGCEPSEIQSPGLTWTEAGYSLEVEARVGGTACFVGTLPQVRPSTFSPMGLSASRVLDDDGKPPAACVECLNDEECQDLQTTLACVEGVCTSL